MLIKWSICQKIILLLLLLFCPFLHAETRLEIAEAFNVKSVNGRSYPANFLQNNSEIKLKPGINRIALEYEVVFEDDDDDNFDIVKSDIFILKFYLQKNQKYRLQYLKQANPKAARKYTLNPLVKIINPQGVQINSTQFFPSSQSIAFVNQSTKKKLVQQPSIQLLSENSVNKSIIKIDTKKVTEQPDVEKMLLFWWQKANQQQRQAFLEKVITTRNQE